MWSCQHRVLICGVRQCGEREHSVARSLRRAEEPTNCFVIWTETEDGELHIAERVTWTGQTNDTGDLVFFSFFVCFASTFELAPLADDAGLRTSQKKLSAGWRDAGRLGKECEARGLQLGHHELGHVLLRVTCRVPEHHIGRLG